MIARAKYYHASCFSNLNLCTSTAASRMVMWYTLNQHITFWRVAFELHIAFMKHVVARARRSACSSKEKPSCFSNLDSVHRLPEVACLNDLHAILTHYLSTRCVWVAYCFHGTCCGKCIWMISLALSKTIVYLQLGIGNIDCTKYHGYKICAVSTQYFARRCA